MEFYSLKFKIDRVGRISEALVEPKNLTMFFGKNDSGKTYAASTIWAVINFVKNVPTGKEILEDSSELVAFLKRIDEDGVNEGTHSFTIAPGELNRIQGAVFEYLNKNLKKTLEDAIGYDGFGGSKVEIELEHTEPVTLKCSFAENREPSESVKMALEPALEALAVDLDAEPPPKDWDFEISLSATDKVVSRLRARGWDWTWLNQFLPRDIRSEVIGYACFGEDWGKFRNTIYIPAARTGIMLALNYFVEGVVRRADMPFSEEKTGRGELPGPIRNFASRMVGSGFGAPKSTLGNSLSRLVGGEIRRGRRRGSFLYAPEGVAAEIPLASSSSLVTELAPLFLMGRRIGPSTFLIFEEPEAHLHLEAQREMARLLALLVNRGVKILITTHSDTFIQQINNLIALSDHPSRQSLAERLGLSEGEFINRDAVCAYDFVCADGITKAKRLPMTKAGFAADSLNDVILRLANETILINNEWPDAEEGGSSSRESLSDGVS